jgi:hypothetical protein
LRSAVLDSGVVTDEDTAVRALADGFMPTVVRRTALALNALLLLTEVAFLLPRAPVLEDEVAMVSLLVATPVVNLVMFFDYYRRGLWVDGSQRANTGDLRPLPTPARWLTSTFNILLMFTEAVLFFDRGINAGAPLEVFLTTLFVATPVVSLAVLLDYNRRGV